eukprot:14108.XXX_159006_152440_1 [CDS] Oithona nana genome sequencing.
MGVVLGGNVGLLLLLLLIRVSSNYISTNQNHSNGSISLKNSSAIVISQIKIPPYVIVGQTVHLYCLFELRNGTDLYTLKWFKDGAEFYRSVPRASVRRNRRLIFPMPGVKVDFENSKIISGGEHQMALQEVELSTSGHFVCQITMDSPPFEFVEAGGVLTVISLPERFPVISGNKGHHYGPGDRVTLNCTCYDTFPAANIRWFINGREVDDSYLIQYVPELSRRSPGLVSATLGLDFTIDESHYAPRTKLASDGSSLVQSSQKELWALCEATMPPIKGTTFPFTREIYLGSLSQTFQHFQSDAHLGPKSKSTLHFNVEIADHMRN